MTDQRHLPPKSRIYRPSLHLDTVNLDTLDRATWWLAFIDEELDACVGARAALPDLGRLGAEARVLVAAWELEPKSAARGFVARNAVDAYRRAASRAVSKANQARREAEAAAAKRSA